MTTTRSGAQCCICERWGTYPHMQLLGRGRYRHDACAPGTPLWLEWYETHPACHTEAGDILYRHAKRKGG